MVLGEEHPNTLASMKNLAFVASTSPYIRHPLKPAQARLLRIDSTDQDGTLRCSFKVIDLDCERLSYYAISYTWGAEPEVMDKIVVDGLNVSIWPSHLTMLRGITHFLNDRAIQDPYVWVDAVCIDQTDKTEREEHVKQMNYVYQGAESVLIWLGQEQPDTELTMTVMQWLGRRVLPATVFEPKFPIPLLADLEADLKSQFDISSQELNLLYHMTQEERSTQDTMHYSHRIWSAWHNFASREWFSRVWTLQELLLARQAIFVCGKKHINWQSLRLMTKNPSKPGRQGQFDNNELNRFLAQYINIYSLLLDKERADFMMKAFNELRFSVSYIMLSGAQRKLEATRLQDHIYGKLGLVRPEIKMGMPVDYNLSPESVFKKALENSCFNDSDVNFSSTRYIVDLWEFAALGPPDTKTPSWLPFYLGQKLFYKNLSFIPLDYERACESLSREILDQARCRKSAEDVIALDVFYVDTIKSVLRSPFANPEMYDDPELLASDNLRDGYSEALSEPVSKWLEAIEELLQAVAKDPSGRQAREMFLHDLFRTIQPSVAQNLEENFCWIRRYAMQYQQTNIVGKAISNSVGSNAADEKRLGSCLASLLSRSSSSYCGTESGRFGRCVSQDAEPGDIVCMIPHGKRLHIFRPINGSSMYRRITTAWFCGWSQGEAASQANNGNLRPTTLKIQ